MVEICAFCDRSVMRRSRGVDVCRYHLLALDVLQEGFEVWKERLGDLTWTNYLRRMSELPDTGQWVKEVALAELQKLER